MPSNQYTLLRFICSFVRQQPWKFFIIVLLSLVWTIDLTFWPYLLRLIIDTMVQFDLNRSAVWTHIKWLVLAAVLIWISIEVAFRTRDFLVARIFPKMEAEIRMTMFDHIQKHSPKYFNEHFAGSLSNRINDMTSEVSNMLRSAVFLFIPTVFSCTTIILIFSKINPFISAIFSLWIIAHFSICFWIAPKCANASHRHGEARSALIGKIVDSLTNNFAVNLFFRFRFEKSRVLVSQKIEREKNHEAQRYSALMFALLSVAYLTGTFALNGFMIFYWIRGGISTGEIVQVFNTMWVLTMAIWMVGDRLPPFFQSIGIAKQALSIMNDPQDILDSPNASPLTITQGKIIFDKVSFQYNTKKLFENKEVEIAGGERVGLVGYSGSGKSTFVNLILRFYHPSQGKILIDDQDLAHVTLESLRSQVALIPQDPQLFHRSLEENIRYGQPDATKEQIIHVAKMAHCDEFIRKCPNGYDTLVGERGTKLSGGERQRIAIARAMLANAPILLLDEATSALDSVTENTIQESLERLMRNRTTIVIAHRLSTLAKMNRILVFDQGKIVEEGSHAELLAKHGHYAQMWKMQAGGFLPDSPESHSK